MESRLDVHWNTLVIPQPPQTTVTIPTNSGVNINIFIASISSLENLLKRINLEFAGALCSRLIYKIKRKFRTTKWMHLIEKINQSMLKLLQMKFTPALKKICESTSPGDCQLPSRSMLEWFLIKMQGLARLLVRLVITSYRAGEMFRQCLSIGHNWQIIVTLMSLVSQIWTNCQLLLKETLKCYKVTHKAMLGSVLNQKPWSSAQLPEDLGVWISEDLAILDYDIADIFRISLPEIKSSTKVEVKNRIDLVPDKINFSTDVTNFEEDIEDLGEIISRDTLVNQSAAEHSCTSETLRPLNSNAQNQENKLECANDSSNIIEMKTKKKKNMKSKKDKMFPHFEKKSEKSIEVEDGFSCQKERVKKKKKSKKKKIWDNSIDFNDQNSNTNTTEKIIIKGKNMDRFEEIIKKGDKLKEQMKKIKKKDKSKPKTSHIVINNPTIINKPNKSTVNDLNIGKVDRFLKRKRRKLPIIDSVETNSTVPSKKMKAMSNQAVETISRQFRDKKICKRKEKLIQKKRFNMFIVEDVT